MHHCIEQLFPGFQVWDLYLLWHFWCLVALPGFSGHWSLSEEQSSLICNIPSSWRVVLLMRSGELIVPLVTRNLATAPQVWFLTVTVNSPFTGYSLCKVLSFTLLRCSVSFTVQSWGQQSFLDTGCPFKMGVAHPSWALYTVRLLMERSRNGNCKIVWSQN